MSSSVGRVSMRSLISSKASTPASAMASLAALRALPRKASPNPANLSSPSVATSAGCNGASYGSVSLVLSMRYVVLSLADVAGARVLLRTGVRFFSVTTALRSGIPGRREVFSSDGDMFITPLYQTIFDRCPIGQREFLSAPPAPLSPSSDSVCLSNAALLTAAAKPRESSLRSPPPAPERCRSLGNPNSRTVLRLRSWRQLQRQRFHQQARQVSTANLREAELAAQERYRP